MNSRIRLPQLAGVIAAGTAAFLLANWIGGTDEGAERDTALVSDVSARPARAAERRPDPPAVDRAAPPVREAIATDSGEETFGAASWTRPPAPPPVVQAPPPPPKAPALPFRFVGVIEDKREAASAFLAKGDALHVVRAGDIVEGTYRIESFSSSRIVLTYLPLGEEQTLSAAGGPP